MPQQILRLKQLAGHPRVDNNCFFTFLADTGEVYFTFKGEARTGGGILATPPVGDTFGYFTCFVHELVVPPKMRRSPSLLSPAGVGKTAYAPEMVTSGGQSQLIRVISSFTPVAPRKGSYAYLHEDRKLEDDDWSLTHHHHATEGPERGFAAEDVLGHGGFDGSCPRAFTAYGYPNELVETVFYRQQYTREELGKLPSWMNRHYPPKMHCVMLETSSGVISYGYVQTSSPSDLRQFRQTFSEPAGVVYGMPPILAIDVVDVFMIMTDQAKLITKEQYATSPGLRRPSDRG